MLTNDEKREPKLFELRLLNRIQVFVFVGQRFSYTTDQKIADRTSKINYMQ